MSIIHIQKVMRKMLFSTVGTRPVSEIIKRLNQRLQGYYPYDAVTDNLKEVTLGKINNRLSILFLEKIV